MAEILGSSKQNSVTLTFTNSAFDSAYDLDIEGFNIDITVDTNKMNIFGADGVVSYVDSGTMTWGGEIQCVYDHVLGVDLADLIAADWNAALVATVVDVSGTTTTAKDYTGDVIINSFKITGSTDDYTKVTFGFVGNGTLVEDDA